MAYIVQNLQTQEYLANNLGIIYFRKPKFAHKYLQANNLTSTDYIIKQEISPKEQAIRTKLLLYDNEIMDLYHAIELSSNDTELLAVASVLKQTLAQRRQTKKIKRPKCGSIKDYRNRTDIIERNHLILSKKGE